MLVKKDDEGTHEAASVLDHDVLYCSFLMFIPTAGAQEDQGLTAVPVRDARSVFIEDYFFNRADACVTPGTTVVWFNQGDEPHTVTADDTSWLPS